MKGIAAAVSAILASAAFRAAAAVPAMDVEDNGRYVVIERGRTTAVFNKAVGALERLYLDGSQVFGDPYHRPGGLGGSIVGGIRLACLAPSTNDVIRYDVVCGRFGDFKYGTNTVKTAVRLTGPDGFDYVCLADYRFEDDGSVTFSGIASPLSFGTKMLDMPIIGLEMRLKPGYEIRTEGEGWVQFTDKIGRGVRIHAGGIRRIGDATFIPVAHLSGFTVRLEAPKR